MYVNLRTCDLRTSRRRRGAKNTKAENRLRVFV